MNNSTKPVKIVSCSGDFWYRHEIGNYFLVTDSQHEGCYDEAVEYPLKPLGLLKTDCQDISVLEYAKSLNGLTFALAKLYTDILTRGKFDGEYSDWETESLQLITEQIPELTAMIDNEILN